MTTRRRFIALGAGISASLFTSGHARRPFADRSASSAPLATPPDYDGAAGIAPRELASVEPQPRGRYSAPIRYVVLLTYAVPRVQISALIDDRSRTVRRRLTPADLRPSPSLR